MATSKDGQGADSESKDKKIAEDGGEASIEGNAESEVNLIAQINETAVKKKVKKVKELSPAERRVQPLKSAILSARPPYCAGTLALQSEALIVFYGKKDAGSHGRIDFNNVTDEELQDLSRTCDKATFGLGQEDVLDETYRKAGKLDSEYFSTKIDTERSGLMNIVRYSLLDGNEGRRPIRAELYKLNVYSKDAFFKSHKDTPRSTTMFGSLVIVLPTQHEGGALILRHNDKDWTFDSAKEIAGTRKIGYVAFFSDVEHEVTLVKSGYRVTLTYNLYWEDEATLKALQLAKGLPMNECAVKNALNELLEDELFFPEGIHLGFGLNHEYPIETKPKDVNTLDFLSQTLKGSDALLMKACKGLSLDARLYVFYTFGEYSERYDLIVPKAVNLDGQEFMEDNIIWHLRDKHHAKLINYKYSGHFEWATEVKIDFPVLWVTERSSFNEQKATYMAYGNQAQLEHAYGRFCLVVKLGPKDARATSISEEAPAAE